VLCLAEKKEKDTKLLHTKEKSGLEKIGIRRNNSYTGYFLAP